MAFDIKLPESVPTIGDKINEIQNQNNDTTANNTWVRDYLKNTYQVPDTAIGWDAQNKQITINNNPFAVQGLTLNNDKSYAPSQNIDTAFKTMFPEGRYKDPNQFQPTYRDEKQGLITDMRQKLDTGFQSPVSNDELLGLYNQMRDINNQKYDPTSDQSLKQAQDQAMLAVQNRMAGSGMLFGDTTKAMMSQEALRLVPEYTKMFYMNQERQLNNLLNTGNFGRQINADAYAQYTDNINNIVNMYDMYDKFDTQDFNIFKENIQLMRDKATSDIQQREMKIKEEEIKYNKARDRVEDLGYVDNTASIVLGLPVGTLSKSAKERINQREDFIFQEKVRLENDMKLVDAQTRKTLATMSAKEKQKEDTSINAILAKATDQQKKLYKLYVDSFYGTPGNEYYQNPDRVYQRLIARPDIAEDVGNELYNAMIQQASTAASKIATVKPVDTSKADQIDADNNALSVAQAHYNNGDLDQWFEQNKGDLANGVSTPTLNKIISLLNQ